MCFHTTTYLLPVGGLVYLAIYRCALTHKILVVGIVERHIVQRSSIGTIKSTNISFQDTTIYKQIEE